MLTSPSDSKHNWCNYCRFRQAANHTSHLWVIVAFCRTFNIRKCGEYPEPGCTIQFKACTTVCRSWPQLDLAPVRISRITHLLVDDNYGVVLDLSIPRNTQSYCIISPIRVKPSWYTIFNYIQTKQSYGCFLRRLIFSRNRLTIPGKMISYH